MTTSTADVRTGLARLAGWLDAHPDLPVRRVEACEAEYAEVRLDADGHEALEAAADVADVLSDVRITVTDTPLGPPTADVVVSGWADTTDADTRFEIGAVINVCYGARRGLLAHLGDRNLTGEREWTITATTLRAVAAGSDVTAGA